jgi:hypothetical protein
MRRLKTVKSASLIAAATAVALAGSACSNSSDSGSTGGAKVNSQANAGTPTSLKGVCPDTVRVATNWWPQAEYGSLYRLIGENPTIDKKAKKVTGKLVDNGVDTGVNIEVDAGGPANNFKPSASLLYTDKTITLGGADLDFGISLSGTKPVLAVFAPMDLQPTVLLWDPNTYPKFNSVRDIGQTSTKVLYFQGSTYMSYLTGTGILRTGQVDPSYDGTPSRFVQAGGKVVQQGFLTNEVYSYEHEIKQWGKKVSWQLISDLGYPNYAEALTINPARKAELAPCLQKLVPALQRAAVGYLSDPKPTNDLIVQLVKDFNAFAYSPERAAYAVQAMKDNGIMGNGSNKTIGDFDTARVQKLIGIDTPIFTGQHVQLKAGVTPNDVVTNEFIDTNIGVKTGG